MGTVYKVLVNVMRVVMPKQLIASVYIARLDFIGKKATRIFNVTHVHPDFLQAILQYFNLINVVNVRKVHTVHKLKAAIVSLVLISFTLLENR
tara:strand:- start:1579 stop:1857 length:279 start_codon:yes stop_codon:yes gene_type:complete